ncbi:MAG: urease accessory UreF family protein [Pseudomonadota bacterium]
MNTDLLSLTQWLSPAFPLGSFAYSHGLETAINGGQIQDAESLYDWLRAVLARGSGWTDAVILSATLDGEDVAQLCRALAASKERLEETEAQGAAFSDTQKAMGRDVPAGPLPVAVGVAARTLNLNKEIIISVYLQSFMSNLVQVAVRFVPLGQSAGQGVLQRLNSDIETVAACAASASKDDANSGAFVSDISSMRHESQSARMFQS